MKKLNRTENTILSSLLAGLAVCTASGVEVLNVNYDDSFPTSYQGYGYAGYGPVAGGNVGIDGTFILSSLLVNPGVGKDGSAALRFMADTTAVEAEIPVPNNYTYMGFGIEMSHGLEGAPLSSPELSYYQVDVSLAASGLMPGVAQSSGLIDVRFLAPDGTLQPDDDDASLDVIFAARYRNSVLAGEDFVDNSFRLDRDYELRQGSLENFMAHYGDVSLVQISVEMGNAINDFGFDNGNSVTIDNVVFTDSPPPPPPAEIPVVEIDFDVNSRSWGGSYYSFANPSAREPIAPEPMIPKTGDLVRTDEIRQVDGTNAQVACLDTSPWVDAVADTYEGTSYLGFAGTATRMLDAGFLPSGDPSDYKLKFDAKAEGFLADPTAKFLVVLYAPDDTILPADEDTGLDLIIRFRIANDNGFGNGFSLTEEFVTQSYNLGEVQLDAGSFELLEQFYGQVTIADFVLEGVSTSDNTGFDANNCIIMDNLELLYLTPPSPSFAVPTIFSVDAAAPDQLNLSFVTIPGHLYSIQTSTDLASGFTEVQRLTATDLNTVYSRSSSLEAREFFRVEDLGVAVQ